MKKHDILRIMAAIVYTRGGDLKNATNIAKSLYKIFGKDEEKEIREEISCKRPPRRGV